ncbi:MAG TPA: UDP-N-acetylmuramate--L-alanine ligase [Candidatus Parabacteroides faecavium]|nr:UDP-N-acetylmuramate--L-alanine ligase [Candidatus Parabacteroides faecavium]
MEMQKITSVYFVGAGGIGMSALARYFRAKGKQVAGYDKTPSDLTAALIEEGIRIHYTDDITLIPADCKQIDSTLVIYTPAIPETHTELNYFKTNGFTLMKRARVLGEITRTERGLCVAGTHGKTTTSSMLAHLLKQSHVDCNAFLGGVLKNYNSNLMLSDKSDLAVIEADEFDRSFHWLNPYMAVITAVDPDHLDIYGTPAAYRESFEHFTSLIRPDGCLVMKKGLQLQPRLPEGTKLYTYSATEEADFFARNIRIGNGDILFDFVTPDGCIPDVKLGVPVKVNIENGVAAMALAWLNGLTPEEIRRGMETFAGPVRRFDFHLKKDDIVLLDDYAHHPAELKASIQSVKELYPDKKVTGIFQPHLYTRTRDFAADFAASLSLLDELILLDIYPAREEPIPGVTSQIIFDRVTIPNKRMIRKEELLDLVQKEAASFEVVLMVGAGNIDRLVEPVKQILEKR